MSDAPAPGINAKIPALPDPRRDADSVVFFLKAIKQSIDSLSGRAKGQQLDRAVTFADLMRLNLASFAGITSATGTGTSSGGGGTTTPPGPPAGARHALRIQQGGYLELQRGRGFLEVSS